MTPVRYGIQCWVIIILIMMISLFGTNGVTMSMDITPKE